MITAETFRQNPQRIRIPLSEFCQLPTGYPLAHDEVRRIMWRGRWWVVIGFEVERRLFTAWRQPVVQVHSELRDD